MENFQIDFVFNIQHAQEICDGSENDICGLQNLVFSMVSKVIIVTGASRGIGLAVASFLLKASHKLVLVSRSPDQMKTLKEEFPTQVEYLAADMTLPQVSPRQGRRTCRLRD